MFCVGKTFLNKSTKSELSMATFLQLKKKKGDESIFRITASTCCALWGSILAMHLTASLVPLLHFCHSSPYPEEKYFQISVRQCNLKAVKQLHNCNFWTSSNPAGIQRQNFHQLLQGQNFIQPTTAWNGRFLLKQNYWWGQCSRDLSWGSDWFTVNSSH